MGHISQTKFWEFLKISRFTFQKKSSWDFLQNKYRNRNYSYDVVLNRLANENILDGRWCKSSTRSYRVFARLNNWKFRKKLNTISKLQLVSNLNQFKKSKIICRNLYLFYWRFYENCGNQVTLSLWEYFSENISKVFSLFVEYSQIEFH